MTFIPAISQAICNGTACTSVYAKLAASSKLPAHIVCAQSWWRGLLTTASASVIIRPVVK